MTDTMRDALGQVLRTVLIILSTFLFAGVLFGLTGHDITDIFSGVLQGAVTAPGATTSTVRWAIPLVLLGLSVIISFRAGFFNIGAQGQFYLGAIAGLTLCLAIPDGPPLLMIPATLAVGALAGMAWGLIPGYLRVRYRAEEVLTTLMLNFIAALFLQYMTGGPLRDASGSGQNTASMPINKAYRLSGSSGVSTELIIITVIVAVAVWVLINRTSFGLQGTLAGRNPLMARWQGIRVDRLGMSSFAISGALAGFAGSMELLGPLGRLVSGFSADIGFTAVLVGLVGLLSVPGVVLAALFFGGLQSAVLYLPIVTPLPRSALDLLEGLVALLITARPPLPGWLQRRLDRSRQAPPGASTAAAGGATTAPGKA